MAETAWVTVTGPFIPHVATGFGFVELQGVGFFLGGSLVAERTIFLSAFLPIQVGEANILHFCCRWGCC